MILSSEPTGRLFEGGGAKGAAPPVTAVVVTHNSARHLTALGRALAGGSVAPSRMLVVDNDSLDATVAQARSAAFDVIEVGANDGFGAACNVGLSACDTEFILLCNPDARPSQLALERLLAALMARPTAAIAGAALGHAARARRFSRLSVSVLGFLPSRLRNPLRRFSQTIPIDATAGPIVVDYAEGAFILCRVAALRAVNGFDERYFLYCEEEDLSRRLWRHGWQTLLVPSAVVTHEGCTSSEGFDRAAMAPFRIHSFYLYWRIHHSRPYAELARCVLAICVTLDRGYRRALGRPQVYGPLTATAPFRTIAAVRRDQSRARAES